MYTLINSIEDLAFLNNELLSKKHIGVDTEFRRTSKQNMKLALLQVNDGEEIYLIDTILIKEPEHNSSFLFSNDVLKIFHSCKEDLEAIYSWTNKKMSNIFDTQLANSFLSNDYSISYQGLVEKKLGIVLSKNETRSNWLRRPLTDSQLKYAALDVEYLIHLYNHQIKEMNHSDKLEWHNQDIDQLIHNTFNENLVGSEVSRSLTRAQENEILVQFNKVVEKIAMEAKINPTLFFSKKSQKDFLRLVLFKGLKRASEEITQWRSELLHDDLLNLLK